MAPSERKPLTRDEIRQIQMLLKNTDLSIRSIAERMRCTRTSIAKVNRDLQVRTYDERPSK